MLPPPFIPVQAMFKHPEVIPAPKRAYTKRKAIERSMAVKVPHVVPESASFNLLLAAQRGIDDATSIRKSEVREALVLPQHLTRKLRMYVFHTHTNQPHQQPQPPNPPTGSSSSITAQQHSAPTATAASQPGQDPPSWVLTIHGRIVTPLSGAETILDPHSNPHPAAGLPTHQQPQQLFSLNPQFSLPLPQQLGTSGSMFTGNGIQNQVLDPGSNAWAGPTAAPATATAAAGRGQPMTHYLRKVEILLDPVLYPGESGMVVWERHLHLGPDLDQIQVRRMGTLPCKATVRVTMDWQPERFVLPLSLSAVLGMRFGSKSAVSSAMFAYLKLRGQRDPQEHGKYILTEPLAEVFRSPTLRLSHINTALDAVLQPFEPTTIEYLIMQAGRFWDPCDLVFPMFACQTIHSRPIQAVSGRVWSSREIRTSTMLDALDITISATLQKINEHRRRRAFFMGFAQSPADFIHALVASQARDLRVITSSSGVRTFEVERRSEVFKQQWVDDAVMKYLSKCSGNGLGLTGAAVPGSRDI
ncbi:MAG: hypothetical protein WDW38_007050 [Sanguina aurantia]